MFGFMSMENNYEKRAVARFENNSGLIVDTCYVNDALNPYETGVLHPSYNDNRWVIVEDYSNEETAEKGHKEWVATMTANKLPKQLTDIGTSEIAMLVIAFSNE